MDSSQQNPRSRNFMCKVSLLCLCGDYPALGKATGFTHSGCCHCHWCNQSSPKMPAVNRHYSGNFRRWLPNNSTMRSGNGTMRSQERRQPPSLREHSSVVRVGFMASSWHGAQALHPSKTKGIKTWCPLYIVPGFDIVWDTVGDFMHSVMYYPKHVVTTMRGGKEIAAGRLMKLKLKKPLPEAELQRRKAFNRRLLIANAKARRVKCV